MQEIWLHYRLRAHGKGTFSGSSQFCFMARSDRIGQNSHLVITTNSLPYGGVFFNFFLHKSHTNVLPEPSYSTHALWTWKPDDPLQRTTFKPHVRHLIATSPSTEVERASPQISHASLPVSGSRFNLRKRRPIE